MIKPGEVTSKENPVFGMMIPEKYPRVPSEIINPHDTWKDKTEYDKTAKFIPRK